MPQRGEYRATTDQMLELIDALRAAEERKRNVPIGSPAFVEAAVEAEHLSRLAFRWAQLELQMATSAKERVAAGQLPADVSLVDVEPRKLDVILAHWREAQLRLEIATPGSPEAERAVVDIERLREEYQTSRIARSDGKPQGQMTPQG